MNLNKNIRPNKKNKNNNNNSYRCLQLTLSSQFHTTTKTAFETDNGIP